MINTRMQRLLFFFLIPAVLLANSFEPMTFKPVAHPLTRTDPLGTIQRFLEQQRSERTVDTLKIMALRAEFVEDDLETTTGNGKFYLADTLDYIIDPPPHNRTYFSHQLLALHNYFKTVSNGRLILEYTVFPLQDTAAYQLPENMVYYSGEEDTTKQKQRWCELVRDVVDAAREKDSPDFSQYDVFMVFHAGVGADISFDFDTTPYDIQSAFIDFDTFQETLGENNPDYQGIPAGDTFIQEAIILPETQNQEEQNLGLLGTMTLLMGSQIGMPSLFNTETGRAGIGRWGLMDQGSFNYNGLIPAHPCAWTKVYMGWDTPVEIQNIDKIEIGSFSTHAEHIIKIPISSNEYFLLENRQRDPNGDRLTFGRDEHGNRAQFDSTFSINVESGLGVITQVDEYDFALPGSGILIWHIDDRVIEKNLTLNTINNNIEHRGVDLVECDGPQDIGQSYGMFSPGYGTESGDYWDPYWDDNISHKYVNGENPVEFSPASIPSSDAYGQAKTSIRISEFSSRDTIMTCRISNDFYVSGFPQYAKSSFGPGALRWLNNATEPKNGLICAVSTEGEIYAWNRHGKVIDNDETVTVTDYAGDTRIYSVALCGNLEDSIDVPPLSLDFDGDSFQDLIVVSRSGHVSVWSFRDENHDGMADSLADLQLNEIPSCAVISGNQLLVGTQSGTAHWIKISSPLSMIYSVKIADDPISQCHVARSGTENELAVFTTQTGTIYAYSQTSPPQMQWQANLAGSGSMYYVMSIREKNDQLDLPLAVLSNDGALTLVDKEGNVRKKTSPHVTFSNTGAPALCDLDADSIPEIIFADGQHLGAYDWTTGVPAMNFPQSYSQSNSTEYSPSPVCLENGLILVATSNGLIRIFNQKGEQRRLKDLQGPLTVGGGIHTEPVLAEHFAEGTVLFALSDDGFLNACNLYDLPVAWAQYSGNSQNQFSTVFENPSSSVPEKTGLLSSAFCYPNPARGSETFVRFNLRESAEHINLRIYDIAGDLISEMQQAAAAAGEYEIRWGLDRVQSGAYIARLQVKNSTETRVKFIKIAVIK